MAMDGGLRVLGAGVLEVAGEEPVAFVSATAIPSDRDRFLIVDCVKAQPRVFRIPEELPLEADNGFISWDYFAVEAKIRDLKPEDARWLSSLDIDELPVPALRALIDVIANMEVDPDGTGPWDGREEGWEGDLVYLEPDGALRYEVVDVGQMVCRAWRRRGEWELEESPVAWPTPSEPVTADFVRLVVGFIDEGLNPTEEIVELVTMSPSDQVEVDDAFEVDAHGAERPVALFMPMDHYLESQMYVVRGEARKILWPHLGARQTAIRCGALEVQKSAGDWEARRTVEWIAWKDRRFGRQDPELRNLCASGVASERCLAAGSLDAPPEMLRHLARDPDGSVAYAAVANPQAPADVCWRALKESREILNALASNPGAPGQVLVELASILVSLEPPDRDLGLINLVRNPASPEEAILAAIGTASMLIQGIAAASPTVTPPVLEALARALGADELAWASRDNPLRAIGHFPGGWDRI